MREEQRNEDAAKIEDQLFQARIKANELTYDFMKQIATVSSALLVVSVSFVGSVLPAEEATAIWLLPIAWLFLVLSICSGLLGGAKLVNGLDVPAPGSSQMPHGLPLAYAAGSKLIVKYTRSCMIAFVLGVAALGAFATLNLPSVDETPNALDRIESRLESTERLLIRKAERAASRSVGDRIS